MNNLWLTVFFALWLITGQAISADADLESSQFVVSIDSNNSIWWGKFISADKNNIMIEVFPDNKLSFMNSPSILINASRDQVFPCIETKKKVVITYSDGRKNMIDVQLICANGFVAQTSGTYFSPKQFFEEVDELDGFKRDVIIRTSKGQKAFVRRVFSDGSIDCRIGSPKGYRHLDLTAQCNKV